MLFGIALATACTGESPERTASDTLAAVRDSEAAPAASFTSLLKLDSSFRLYGSAAEVWSPDGRKLGMRGPGGLYVLDLNALERGPIKVIEPAPINFCWSPNGRLVACRMEPDPRRGQSALVSVDVETAAKETLLEGSSDALKLFRWADDGKIYCWHMESGRRSVVEPSEPGVNTSSRGSRARSLLVSGGGRTFRFDPATQREEPLASVDWPNVSMFAVRGVFPNGHLLAQIHERRSSPYGAVTDSMGSVITILGSDGNAQNTFHATSLAPDGQVVLGFIASEGGHAVISSATVMLSHPDGLWRIRVEGAPDSIFPRFSPVSYLVALSALSGEFHLGEIKIQSR